MSSLERFYLAVARFAFCNALMSALTYRVSERVYDDLEREIRDRANSRNAGH